MGEVVVEVVVVEVVVAAAVVKAPTLLLFSTAFDIQSANDQTRID